MSPHILTNSQVYIPNCYPPVSAQPGVVWYDSREQCLKVYDGNYWIRMDWPISSLSWEANLAIDQMISQMNRKGNLAEMAAKYPLVAEALGQLEVALKLCENLDGN